MGNPGTIEPEGLITIRLMLKDETGGTREFRKWLRALPSH